MNRALAFYIKTYINTIIVNVDNVLENVRHGKVKLLGLLIGLLALQFNDIHTNIRTEIDNT